ncbi:MAG: hypothetical protein EAZ12_02615 [Sphingobacteriia bacterium]|nr:MAG: hypothetical protein EAZ12_02615 [Sphingobacteriia bacterium]
MRISFFLISILTLQLLKAQLPVIHYDSGKITINGIAVSKSTPKSTLEELLGSKAWSGNLAHIGDPITQDRTKQPFKYTYIIESLGISMGWFNQPPQNLECSFFIQKSTVPEKNKRDRRVAFPGKVFIGSLQFDKNLNVKDFENQSDFKVVAIGMGKPEYPFTLISYQNTLIKCYFNTDGYLQEFSTHL